MIIDGHLFVVFSLLPEQIRNIGFGSGRIGRLLTSIAVLYTLERSLTWGAEALAVPDHG
jgi:hypothetical protein